MNKKAATLLLAGVIIAGGTIAFVTRDEARSSTSRLLALVSWTAASEAAAQPSKKPVPQVPVAEVVSRKVALSVKLTGHLETTKFVELRPRVGGAIDAVSVPEGGLVRPGQILFKIDPRPFQIALDAAKAQLQQAAVLLDQAEIDFKRAETLAPNGAVSRKTFDEAQTVRRQRQAQVEVAMAAVAAAELDLSFTRVTAPISGRVDRVLVTEGNLVAGGNAGAATLLTTIVSTDPLYVYFDIDEVTYLEFVARARAIESGKAAGKLPVHVGLMTDAGFPHTGELDFLGNRVDRSTGTIRARAVVNNPDGRLAPGLFARVNLVTAEPVQTVLIDDKAIGIDQGSRYVLVLGTQDKAEYRSVKLGPMFEGLRVVTAGLNSGEKIIVKGLVRPGMRVVPQMISMLSRQSTDSDRSAAETQEARR